MNSIKISNVYLNDYYTVISDNKYETDILLNSSKKVKGYYFDKKSVEEGESVLLKKSIEGLKRKTKISPNILIGGDLQNQLFSQTLANANSDYPFLGVYSACASLIESMIISSILIENNMFDNIYSSVSSSNLASEKQFRFPIEYGALRKCDQTLTLTSSCSLLLSKRKSDVKIKSFTIGRVIDVGFKDVNNMGALMAPSTFDTIVNHMSDLNKKIDDYDLIVTGDLGIYGLKILTHLLEKKYNKKINNIIDAGASLLKTKEKHFPAGASGPVCIGLYLCNEILKTKKHKKVLLVGTGALFNKTTVNLKLSLPSISHAISLEVN